MCRISPGTSKSQFARARQHLQQQLAARYPEKARKLG
jgi:DNA-directed RNA polymerase specialized sigma24 family protein